MEAQREHSLFEESGCWQVDKHRRPFPGVWLGEVRGGPDGPVYQVNIFLSGSECHRRPVTWQGALRATIKGQHMYFLPLRHQKASHCSWGSSRGECELKTHKCLWRNCFWAQLPSIPFNHTSGWLLVSSSPFSLLAHSSKVWTGNSWGTFQPLGGHLTSHASMTCWQCRCEALLRTPTPGGREDLRLPPQSEKASSTRSTYSPRGGASTNSQFRKRPKGSLESEQGEMRQLPSSSSVGASQWRVLLCPEEINAGGHTHV